MGKLLRKLHIAARSKGLIDDHTARQFTRYVFTGLTAFAAEYASFFILLKLFGIWYIYSNITAMIIGLLVSFILNKTWSFASSGHVIRQFTLFVLLFVINLVISSSLMYYATDVLHISPLLSKVAVAGVTACWNFILYKKVIYKR